MRYMAGHLGNGLTVWDRQVMKGGDYKTVAHIDSERNVKWFTKRPSKELKEYVEALVSGPNMSVSTTQHDQMVFVK
jgi:hypothetical protein